MEAAHSSQKSGKSVVYRRQFVNILFPVFAVKWHDSQRIYCIFDQAVGVNADSIGMRPRHVKRLDAAVPTKIMLGDATIEPVSLERVFPAHQVEILFRNNDVQVTAHATDTAIALISLYVRGRLHFKRYATTVTSTPMRCHGDSLPIFAKQRLCCWPAWRKHVPFSSGQSRQIHQVPRDGECPSQNPDCEATYEIQHCCSY